MKVSLNLCLLFGFISPVVLLICNTCNIPGGTECPQETEQQCSSEASCRTSIFNSNVIVKGKIGMKLCSPSTMCHNGNFTLATSGGGFLNMLVDCCTTDKCNSKPLEVYSEPKEPNGLECRGCQVEGRLKCKGTEMVKCLGDQTKCISMTIDYFDLAVMGGKLFSTKGCATPLMCNQSKWKAYMDMILFADTKITAKCTNPILSPNVSSLA